MNNFCGSSMVAVKTLNDCGQGIGIPRHGRNDCGQGRSYAGSTTAMIEVLLDIYHLWWWFSGVCPCL